MGVFFCMLNKNYIGRIFGESRRIQPLEFSKFTNPLLSCLQICVFVRQIGLVFQKQLKQGLGSWIEDREVSFDYVSIFIKSELGSLKIT